MKAKITLIIIAVGAIWVATQTIEAAPKNEVTLLGTLAEWTYPGADFGGASMSDGGNRTLQSVNCQAVLTTTDSVEQVAKHYADKFVSGPSEAGAAEEHPGAQSVSTQNDSEGRTLQLRVITVNRAASSTTLVISRADGEMKTHIAWSHYLRLGGE